MRARGRAACRRTRRGGPRDPPAAEPGDRDRFPNPRELKPKAKGADRQARPNNPIVARSSRARPAAAEAVAAEAAPRSRRSDTLRLGLTLRFRGRNPARRLLPAGDVIAALPEAAGHDLLDRFLLLVALDLGHAERAADDRDRHQHNR